MSVRKTSLFIILCIALGVSARKWNKEIDFNSQKIAELLRQGFEISCRDCLAFQYQLPGSPPRDIEVECLEGTVCGPIDGQFQCIDADSSDASECSCGDAETSFFQDPYEPMQYYACLPGGEKVTQECDPGEFFTGDHIKPCAKIPVCDASNMGFNKDTCTRSYFCLEDGATASISNCEAGTVWDEVNFGCVDPCSLAPEAFTCDGKEDGAHPDTTDCSIFHLCFFGTHIQQECGANTPFFNADTKVCVETDTDPSNCPPTNECYEDHKATCTGNTMATEITTTRDGPTESTTIADPTESTTGAGPTESTTGAGPTESTTGAGPTESTTGAGPTESTTGAGPTESTTGAGPTDSTTGAGPTESTTGTPLFCDGKVDGPHPDPTDCSRFHLCIFGNHITNQCSDATPYFDPTDSSCKADPEVCSTTTPETTPITTTPTTKTPIKTTPTSNTPTATTTQTKSTTETSETPSTPDIPDCSKVTEQEYFAKLGSCKEFYTCESDRKGGFVLKEYSCPGELVFDPVNQYCNLLNLVPSCGDSPTVSPSPIDPTPETVSPDIDCEQVTSQVYFPHAEICNKFNSCESDGNGGFIQKEYSCPGDLVFDPVNQYCNLLNLVPSCQ